MKKRVFTGLLVLGLLCGSPLKAMSPTQGSKPAGENISQEAQALRDKQRDELFLAVSNNDTKKVAALIAAGIDVNAQEEHGYTALMLASTQGYVDIVSQLITAEADVNIRDKEGETALIKAAEGADNAEAVELLIAAKADVNIQDKHGRTALIQAAKSGEAEVARQLITAGANVDVKNNRGETALMSAAGWGRVEVVKLLVAAGADLDAQPNYGSTALMSAVRLKRAAVVEQLIAAGADLNMKDATGRTALDIARSKGYKEIVALIEQALKIQEQRALYTQELLQKTPLAAELAQETAGYLAAPIKEQRALLDAYAQTILKQIGDALVVEQAKYATSQATNTLLEMEKEVARDRELIDKQTTEESLFTIQDRLTQNYRKLLKIRSKQ